MARGDVVSEITSIAAGADMDFQPAAGVEVMITEIGSDKWAGTEPDGSPAVDVQLYDGALESWIRNTNQATTWARELRLFLNNTHYLRLNNRDAATASLSYCGIQTK